MPTTEGGTLSGTRFTPYFSNSSYREGLDCTRNPRAHILDTDDDDVHLDWILHSNSENHNEKPTTMMSQVRLYIAIVKLIDLY